MKKFLLLILTLAIIGLSGFPSRAGGVSFAQSLGKGDDTLKQTLEKAFLNPPYSSADRKKSQNKTLEKLFDKYDDAESDEEEIAALERIIDYSIKHHQDSAFLYAAEELNRCYYSVNYKIEDSISRRLIGIAEEYGNPLLVFMVNDRLGEGEFSKIGSKKRGRDFLRANKEQLQQRRTQGLYDYSLGDLESYGRIVVPIVEFCKDDYEYLLWNQFFIKNDDKLLKEYVKGRHPQEEILEVASAISFSSSGLVYRNLDTSVLKKLQQKYEGTYLEYYLRAVSLLSAVAGKDSKNNPDHYQDCLKFLEDIELAKNKYKSFSSYLQRLKAEVEQEKTRLEKKEAGFFVDKGNVYVSLHNIKKLDFSILKPGAKVDDKPETVFRKHLKSSKDSFGLYDTLVFAFPKLEDGNYILEGKGEGDILEKRSYIQNSISATLLKTLDGYCLLASDYADGNPLKEYALTISESSLKAIESQSIGIISNDFGKRMYATTVTADNQGIVRLDGDAGKIIADFEKSVESLQDKAPDQTLALKVSYTDKDGYYRCSPLVPIGRFLPPKYETDIDTNALLMTDNVLYHPKDSLRFKVVAYSGNKFYSFNTLDVGVFLSVDLYDAGNRLVESKSLRLNSFGSASSSFYIPEGQKNGRWKLKVSNPDGKSIIWKHVRVDDYFLPTFFMEIDSCNTMFKLGDTITVSGTIEGYSGHPISDADVKMMVENYDDEEDEYKVVLQRKVQILYGCFVSERIVAENPGRNIVSFVITDQSGETQVFWTDRFVDCNAWCNFEIVNNNDGGRYFLNNQADEAYRRQYVITSDTVRLSVDIHPLGYGFNFAWHIPYKCSIWDSKGNEVFYRDGLYGKSLYADLSELEDGVYDIEAYYNEPGRGNWDKKRFLLLRNGLPEGVESVFIPVETEDPESTGIDVRVGVSSGVNLTAAVSCGGTVMEHRLIHLDGDRRLHKISFDYPVADDEEATIGMSYVKDGRIGHFNRLYPKKSRTLDMFVEAVEFRDELMPNKEYRFSFKTDSPVDMEAVVSAYDASADALLKGYEAGEAKWNTVSLKEPYANQAFSVYSGAGDLNNGHLNFIDDNLRRRISRVVGSAASYTGSYRSDFKDVLCFIPHIESKDSTISFTVKTSDKLSTYHLNLFAHTRDMHNTFLQKDFKVTIPVKVSISQPSYLYRGDIYDVSATVSSKSADCDGEARIEAYEDAESTIYPYSKPLALAGGTSSSFNQKKSINAWGDSLNVTVSYISDKYSDGVYVKIPLKKDIQSLTESHSAVLLSSGSREAALKHLKESFRNMSSEDAVEKEETVSDILQRLISKSDTPKDKDLVSVMDAFCFAKMLEGERKTDVPDTVWTSILTFRNRGGGFAWLKQMPSNQSITAAALERFALLRDMGCEIPDMTSSVRYLDSIQFARDWPWWCGGLNIRQYLYVRSMFPEVPFRPALNAENKDRISNYLCPSKSAVRKDIVSKYDVLELARRSSVIRNLLSSESGRKLLKSLTGKSYSKSNLQKTLDEDIFHITDHAVHHPDGGSYYPNAVMPLKGMIENEAYAHSLIADVLSAYSKDFGSSQPSARAKHATSRAAQTASSAAQVADQVRLWLILQAQTQDWEKNLYFLNAVRSINQVSDSIKRTSVLTLSNTEEKRFDSVVQSGNGMKIERILYRDSVSTEDGTSGLRARIRVGDTLRRGEKIIAEYRIWNKENRSFVMVSAPREACMMPVNQLSGKYYGLKSLIVDGYYSFEPTGYRSVETERTRYYFDVLPEETTVLKEEFFVVQDGVYTAPVVEVECSYAPMYRANGAFGGRIPVSR
ncbi:MAG: hypothetical protein IJK39_01640 [Bacteroidales bacterium]|nr:hypothetical protein [Bacteroidales bacterium]